MKYDVQVVEDHELPQGIKRVIVERTGDDPLLILARSIAANWQFIQDWEDGQHEPAEVFELRAAG